MFFHFPFFFNEKKRCWECCARGDEQQEQLWAFAFDCQRCYSWMCLTKGFAKGFFH